jgi:hypothetical protein
MSLSGISLLYTAVVVPAQIFLWDYSDPCNTFPTLFLDVAVDSFFLVTLPERACCAGPAFETGCSDTALGHHSLKLCGVMGCVLRMRYLSSMTDKLSLATRYTKYRCNSALLLP